MNYFEHYHLPPEELNAANLEGATIYGADDETIGTVSHIHGTGPEVQVIVDVGGFLGIGAKPVALDLSRLDFMRDDDGTVFASTVMTRDEVKSLPEHHH